MKRAITSLLFLIGLSFVVTTYAEVVTYYNTFNVGKKEGQYRVDDGSAVYGTSLAPFYSNLRYYESGDSNLRFNLGEGYIKMANGSGKFGTLQMDASNFLSSATNYDLTLGDLVYECYNACSWNGAGAGGAHNGISINNNQMRFIYHPGYTNGAFRIEGDFGSCTNQNIGFTPGHNNDTDFTMMKLTIHRDDDAGNYIFTTEFGQATRTSDGWDTTGYTYSYVHTCPIATIDAAGGIKSIGPYGNHNNDACVTNLRLDAPFPDAAVAEANTYTAAQQYVISNDQPTHWYKFDDSSTNVIKDYGSSPVDVTARNIDMSAISDLRQVADVSGNYSQVDLTGTNNISGDWTAEFYINPSNITNRQALTSGSNGSLRWIMNSGKPGFTKWGAYDAEFKGPDGVSAFSYDLSQILDEWIHVAYVRQDSDLFFYIDGELVGKNASNQPAIDLPLDRTIGSNGTGELFSGMIDDIAFYSYALTAEQIMAHAFPTLPDAAVPEPSTWALLVLGVVVLFLRKRVRS